METPRLPAHLEVAGILRAVENAGGFGTVLAKGERDAGTLLIVCCEKGGPARLLERMPRPDGRRAWTQSRQQAADNPHEFWDYLERRKKQDSDVWVVELDVAEPERFIA